MSIGSWWWEGVDSFVDKNTNMLPTGEMSMYPAREIVELQEDSADAMDSANLS